MAYQAHDYATAIRYWEQLLQQISANSADGKMLLTLLADAQQKQQQHSTTKGIKLVVHVALANNIRATVGANDSVFIYAKAESGPPMPLAVVRKQVKDLPCTVTLDQSQAMMANFSLQNTEKVRIFARISKSGQPLPQSGDWQGMSAVIDTQHPPAQINILIRQRVL
jgi:cytochrome c-type biogenesis protein CcmH